MLVDQRFRILDNWVFPNLQLKLTFYFQIPTPTSPNLYVNHTKVGFAPKFIQNFLI